MYGNYYISGNCDEEYCEIDYDVPIEENFESSYIYTLVPGILTLLGVGLIVSFMKKFTNRYSQYICFVSIFVAFILLLGMCVNIVLQKEEYCEYNRWCHQGINNTIVSSRIYYRLLNEKCPESGYELTYMYSNLLYDSCETDCCRIEGEPMICERSINYEESFTEYQSTTERKKEYPERIYWEIDLKSDKCPDIEDVINVITTNSHTRFSYFMVTIYVIYIVLIVILVCVENVDHNYERGNSQENTDTKTYVAGV